MPGTSIIDPDSIVNPDIVSGIIDPDLMKAKAEPEASWGEVEKAVAKNLPSRLFAGATGAISLGMDAVNNKGIQALLPGVRLLNLLKEPVNYSAKYWSEKAEKETEELNLKPGSAKSYASMIQESTAQQLPIIAGGLATGGMGFILPAMGVLTAGQKKAQFLSAGSEGGNLNAITQGIIEAVTEKIPLGQWLKPGASFMKRLITATATEIPGEQIAAITQGALDKVALNPEMSWGEYFDSIPTAAKDTLIVTIGQSFLMGGPIHGMAQYAEHRQKIKEQLQTQFEVPELEAEQAIGTAEQNIRELAQPTPEEAAGLHEVLGENPEEEINKVKNAAILSEEMGIDPGMAYEYQDEIIKELENKIATESPMMVGKHEAEPVEAPTPKKGPGENMPAKTTLQPEAGKEQVYRARGLEDAIEIRKEQGSLATYDEQSQREWLRGATPPKDGKLTFYRATPTGEEIKPGDYVTNDLQYAKDHIKNNLGGKGKITKIEATLDDIYPADGPGEFWYAPKGIETPLDRDGSELVDLDNNPIAVNSDGTITLYHRTTAKKAEQIKKTGNFKSLENADETFFSNKVEGQAEGYGDAVISVKVKPSDVALDDAFHNGEIHVAVSNKKLSKNNLLPNPSRPPEVGGHLSHQDIVKQALSEGKPVPPEVLADYPELQAQYDLGKQPGIPGERGLRAVGLETIRPDEIVTNEKELLKFKLKSEARGAKAGYKEGRKIARAETIARFNEKNLTTEEARKSVVNYLNESLKPKDRGKFLNSVKNAKTPEQAARAFSRIDRYAEKQELKEAIRNLKTTTDKLSESKAISVDYRNKIKDVIDQYELSGHTEKTLNKLKATQEYLDRVKGEGEDVEMPQRVLNKLKILSRIPKDELTLSQVQGLQNEIELMEKLGKTKWKSKVALYEAEKQARKEALLETVSPINSNIIPQVPIGTDSSQWINRYIALRNYLQKTRIGLTAMDALADVTGMQNMKADLDLNYGNYLTYNDEVINQWYELTKDFKEGNFERIGAVAASRQEGGLERLLNTGIAEEEIKNIKLTPEEEKAYEFARKTFEKEFPAVKKYAADVYNVDVGKVKDYVSFMSDYEAMSDLEIYERFGQRAEELANKRTKTVEKGFLEKRAKVSPIKLELNIDKIFRRHMDDVAYMLTMGNDIKQYFEIVNSHEMKEKLGDTGSLAWLQWLDLMARKGGTEGAKRIALLDTVRKNIGAGILGFRLSSVLVQVTSFTDSIATIGAEWSTKGATSIATSKEWRDFIMDNFPEIKKAVGDDVAFREFDNGLFSGLTRAGMKPLQFLDGIMRSVAASGAYQKLASDLEIPIDLKNPNKGLIQETTKLMRYSQGSSFFKDQPLAYTTGYGLFDNQSINKTILTFQSFLLNRWSNIVRQIWRLGIKEKDYKKAAFSFFWLIVFAGAMEEGVRRMSREIINLISGDEQEEKSFARNTALNVVQNVPIAGQLVSSLTYSSNPVPVINAVEEGLSGMESIVKGKKTRTKARGVVRAAGAAGSVLGVPGASQAAQIVGKAIKK